MIVCHFFLRCVKNKTYLMCQTAVSAGSRSPWGGPTVVLETCPGETAVDWLPRARDMVAAAHPDHAVGDVTYPRRDKGASQVFDICLKQPVKKGVFQRIFRQ